jgi:hypothetical protein
MFRSILAALAAGVCGAFRFGLSILFWPFLMFGQPARAAAAGVDLAGIKGSAAKAAETRKQVAEAASSLLRERQMGAQIAWSWVATSTLVRVTQPLPSALSKILPTWLQGLDHAQLMALKTAGKQGIFEHCSGKKPIAKVPPMQPLAPVVVRYPARIQEAAREIAKIGFRPA